ncbi:MAG: flagellar biosynthetic protein FliO [Lachnospiraceae bacterium]|nr:flagellar biosynthetic protein FliO [Lachnospiraceae bacterium]
MLMTSYSKLSSFAQLITLIIVFIFVLGLTVVATRWMGKLQKQQYKCTNIEVIETCRISNTKYIQIVRTGQKYVVIAVCKDTVTMLTELQQEELELITSPETSDFLGFQEILMKVKERNKKK